MTATRPHPRPQGRPRLELLEDRTLPAQLVTPLFPGFLQPAAPAAGAAAGGAFSAQSHLQALTDSVFESVRHQPGPSATLDAWSARLTQGATLGDMANTLTAAPASSPNGGIVPGINPLAVTLKQGLPAVFQAFGPERLLDTRNPAGGASPFNYGGPSFSAGQVRTFNVSPYNLASPSHIGVSNLPSPISAVSVTVYLLNSSSANYLTLWGGGSQPLASTIFLPSAGSIDTGAIVPVDGSGNINVYAAFACDVVLDVNGYFLNTLDGTDYLPISGNTTAGGVIIGTNASTAGSANGIEGVISSTGPGGFSAGVRGVNNGTGGNGIGVYGSQNGTGWGVYGTANGGIGGNFSGGSGTGVEGSAGGSGSIGGEFFGDTGVYASGSTYGIQVTGGSTGIYVNDSGASPGIQVNNGSGYYGIQVNNTGAGYGVYATSTGSNGWGVRAIGDTYGVYASGSTYALYGSGNFAVSGTKSFVDPSPTNPAQEIRYVTLEGPEAGIYYRGTGHFTNGTATVTFPDYFTQEAETTGLSIQVEPIGALAETAVQTLDTTHAVLLGSQDVDFSYTVYGIRTGYANYNPITTNTDFVPGTVPWNTLNAVQQQRLIDTGLFNPDGTPNLAMAQALGLTIKTTNGSATTA
jgi:hypothetical protein